MFFGIRKANEKKKKERERKKGFGCCTFEKVRISCSMTKKDLTATLSERFALVST